MRIVVTSRASAVTVATADAIITNAAVERIGGGLGERPVVEGGRVGYTGNVPGFEVDATFRVTLAHVRGSRVTFQTERGGPGRVTLEVANINDDLDPQVVDRFSSDDSTANFSSSAQELREGPRLAIGEVTPRLVLAHYYPWYDRSTWSSPFLVDRPQEEYSTEDPGDVKRVLDTAAAAGLDGLVVSWQGLDFQGGWNHRRLQVALEAARQSKIRIAVLFETTVANPEHEQNGVPADPRTVTGVDERRRPHLREPSRLSARWRQAGRLRLLGTAAAGCRLGAGGEQRPGERSAADAHRRRHAIGVAAVLRRAVRLRREPVHDRGYRQRPDGPGPPRAHVSPAREHRNPPGLGGNGQPGLRRPRAGGSRRPHAARFGARERDLPRRSME